MGKADLARSDGAQTARSLVSNPLVSGMLRAAGRAKLLLRRVVVATSFPPIRSLYAEIYRLHISYAVRTLRAIPNLRAIYLKRNSASDEFIPGVSDIDLLVIGDWTADRQAVAVSAIQRLSRLSPLYDRASAHQVHSIEALKASGDMDYYFQYRLDQARRHYPLIYGQDLLAPLPPIATERARGAYFMELKPWWMMFTASAFGKGPTASDSIFRNSIACKAVAEVLILEDALHGNASERSRSEVMQQSLQRAQPEDRATLQRLIRCRASRYLRYEGDVFKDAFPFLLRRIVQLTALLAKEAPFQEKDGLPIEIDGSADEVYWTPPAVEYAQGLVANAKNNWTGYQRAALLPRCSFVGLDDLQLVLECDPQRPPTVEQVRALLQLKAPETLRQRVAIYLLFGDRVLGDTAFLLLHQSPLEFWHILQTPEANPDLFILLTKPEFVIDGAPLSGAQYRWTRFAAASVGDELKLRQSAIGKTVPGIRTDSLFMIRAIWRTLQLLVIQRSAASGTVQIPITPAAIQRSFQAWGLDLPILEELRTAYQNELEGRPSNAVKLIPQVMSIFMKLTRAAAPEAKQV
jgi:hypothetical protein